MDHLRPALEKALTYTDKKVEFEIARLKKSERFLIGKIGEEEFRSRMEFLKLQRKKSLLFDDNGAAYTYSGLAERVAAAAKEQVQVEYHRPSFSVIPWAKKPIHQDRPYQVEAHDRLIEAMPNGPCGVELATGAGKSTIIRNVLKTIALPAVIMAPSTSIAGQLYDDLTSAFGKKYVGLYGDGKKEYKKQFVVGIDDSLTRVRPGSEIWKVLSSKPVFIADESHLCPASTLAKVCFELMAGSPYRLFFSATQMRNDGLDLVLDAITGQIVMRKDVRELVAEGYLARPVFKMVECQSNSSFDGDPVVMTRKHLYYNRVVNEIAADLANKFVSEMKRPVVILVEEVEQFTRLLPHLKHKAKFAHAPLSKDNKDLVPEEYHKDKPTDLVDAFNRGEIPILVGTSCIATGTDIRVAEAGIYLMGGKSEIKVKQGLGRMTRGGTQGSVTNPWTGQRKLDAIWVDFCVSNVETMVRHARARSMIYAQVHDAPKVIDMNGRM